MRRYGQLSCQIRLSAAVLLLSMTWVGCGGAAPEPERAHPPLPVSELPDRAEFIDRGLAVAVDSRADLISTFGPADSILEEEIANRHNPEVRDTIYNVYHSGRMTRIHHPGGGGDLLSMVEVSDNRHLRYRILGLEVDAIESAFGPPDERSDSAVIYRCTTCQAGDDPVELLLERDIVQRVRFNFYVD